MNKDPQQFMKAVYLNKAENEIFERYKKELEYPSNTDFLRALISAGLIHVEKFQPSPPFNQPQNEKNQSKKKR